MMNQGDEKKNCVVISMKKYQEDEKRWFEESLERPVVVVNDEGERLFSMELIRDEEPVPAAAE